jgi:hypothetical protein
MRQLSSAIWFSLISFVASSPVFTSIGRRDNTSVAPKDIFNPETLELVRNTTAALGIPGGIIAFTSPKGDGVLTFGNRTWDDEPVTPEVSTNFVLPGLFSNS